MWRLIYDFCIVLMPRQSCGSLFSVTVCNLVKMCLIPKINSEKRVDVLPKHIWSIKSLEVINKWFNMWPICNWAGNNPEPKNQGHPQ